MIFHTEHCNFFVVATVCVCEMNYANDEMNILFFSGIDGNL
jgi:hypothetical protein